MSYRNRYSLLTAQVSPEWLFVLRPEYDAAARAALTTYAMVTEDLGLKQRILSHLNEIVHG